MHPHLEFITLFSYSAALWPHRKWRRLTHIRSFFKASRSPSAEANRQQIQVVPPGSDELFEAESYVFFGPWGMMDGPAAIHTKRNS